MRRLLAVIAVCGALAGGAAAAAAKGSASRATIVGIESAKWAPVFPEHPEGPSIAVLWGEVQHGPVGLLLRFPAGFATPTHVHSSDYEAVVISGRFSHAAGKDATSALAPGSYWAQRARLPHVNTCSADGPCVVYITAPKGFDFLPVK
jgi:hypothetical protein